MADRYKIYEQLGAGGNGAVYRAYDGQLKRWVAIKRLLSATEAQSEDPNMAELRKEADTLASLRNSNIVTIFDVSTDAEGLFIVMELLEGPDLSDAIAHGPLHLDDFKQLAEQTLEALLVAHQHRVLHRDIKPENIKVERLPGGRLQAKIIDFGLARAGFTARKQTEDQDGSVMGSIYYMAPEQLSREPTDPRTDLYSLGCVFYEALSGRKPFDGKDVMDVVDKHVEGEFTPLAVVCPYLPQWLTYWVDRLMARKPDERPATAQQAIEEFRAWEKLPAQPGIAPWMPMYQPAYAYMPQPQPQYPTGGVPTHSTGYYPVDAQQTGPVPAGDPYASQPIPMAQIIPEAVPAAVPAHATQQLQRPAPRPAAAARSSAARQPAAPAAGGSSNKKPIIIGAAAVAVLGLGFVLLSGKKSTTTGTTSPKPPSSSDLKFDVGPAREDKYPGDRGFPVPDVMRALHVMGQVGPRGFSKDASGKPVLLFGAGDKATGVWDDLSNRGGNNLLRAAVLKPEHSPEKRDWTNSEGTLKGGRRALWFAGTGGRATGMSYSTGDRAAIDAFPFGTVSGAFRPGMTLAVVFNASASRLPSRVIRLSTADGQSSVSLQVMQNRAVRASIVTNGKTTDIESANIDATQPCSAMLTWSGENTEAILRTREARGITHRSDTIKHPLPSKPLSNVTVGTRFDTGKNVFATDDMPFEGSIAEIIVFSTTLKDDQLSLLDKDLREYYFVTKPGSSNPQKNKDLADWAVGEEHSIFNGKDLTGWNGKRDIWSVQDGALTGKGNESHPSGAGSAIIFWDQGTAKDFELRLKIKANGWGSGIIYRSNVGKDTPAGFEYSGYQADIDLGGNRNKSGSLYESGIRGTLVDKPGKTGTIKDDPDPKKFTADLKTTLGDENTLGALIKTNDWNDYVVIAEGNHLKHIINGKPFLDIIDEGRGANKTGIIGLEVQLKSKQILQFKDIKLKRLR